MGAELATVNGADALIQVLALGDLSRLSPEQKVEHYRRVCESTGLNPLTRPFEYIVLNGKLTLYARKDATDQLRKVNAVSIAKPDIQFQDDWIVVTVTASTGDGRTDADVGVVNKKDMRGDYGNALMKAVTKAKRRVTLSICGLGLLDETEVETIPDARPHFEPPALPARNGHHHQPAPPPPADRGGQHETPPADGNGAAAEALVQAIADADTIGDLEAVGIEISDAKGTLSKADVSALRMAYQAKRQQFGA